MFVITREGARYRVRAGPCRIGPHSSAQRTCAVHWEESGVQRSAEIAADELSGYVRGCVVQYA
jgi:hypothetical protein